ncbi:ABC transporter substrate-binding protein [Thermosynechococcus sp. PP45]|uniref:ABC transporter substrate-binding protein n=1 Tax=unclassified Thermosynechococcus TaxID=2622553 RepID=UPI0026724005|nr:MULTISPECIES: ABC transporter substrate-binding protein [unclassified Thermosynechococcus]WKT81806.1 ABC transporter substrate-binding protein [Thermosynechococcus sp. PP45]WNC25419.1 ABC transporter substrate-binding protein [Thermosynechococcus sp. PP551]WNC27997.1 ABC transporter substrate-binding protein [Thermosynechococcus sp. PP555]
MAPSPGSWKCDGVPKNGKSYPNASGAHPPYENFGPDCDICGLPREAMNPASGNSAAGAGKWKLPLVAAALGVVLLLAGGIGFLGYRIFIANRNGTTPLPIGGTTSGNHLVSKTTARNTAYISQGERILISEPNPQRAALKQEAALAFDQGDWAQAIAKYQELVTLDPNDPEARIYLNNARARQAGNPMTMATVVPIGTSPDTAKEILRGVAQYQERFNASGSSRALEVAIVNENSPNGVTSLAEDLINSSIQGVLGHGTDANSRAALQVYEQAGIAALSPLTTNVIPQDNGTVQVQTLSLSEKGQQLLNTYLDNAANTLAQAAAKKVPNAKVAVLYNSDSPYSDELKTKLVAALPRFGAQVVQQMDVAAPGFNANTAMTTAQQAGANVVILAMSRARVNDAVALAIANQTQTTPLQLFGSDQLYSPDLLIKGDSAINGMILAVPWSTNPNDPFAQQAAQAWRGQISWRTTTAYDATQALAQAMVQGGDRASTQQLLRQGVQIQGQTASGTFDRVPLVQAAPGPNGPKGSNYQFNPLGSL